MSPNFTFLIKNTFQLSKVSKMPQNFQKEFKNDAIVSL